MFIPLYNADGVAIRTFLGFDAPEWTAILTLLILVATILLWLAAKETLEETRDMFVQLNSPHVALKTAFNGQSKAKMGHFGVMTVCKNFGPTPVNDVSIDAVYSSTESDVDAPLPLDTPHISIVPGGEFSHFIEFDPSKAKVTNKNGESVDATSELIYEIFSNGEFPLFLRVEIYYKGLYGEEYVYYYKGEYDYKNNKYGVMNNWAGKVKECPEDITKKPPKQSRGKHPKLGAAMGQREPLQASPQALGDSIVKITEDEGKDGDA